jgi:hypothetical protein
MKFLPQLNDLLAAGVYALLQLIALLVQTLNLKDQVVHPIAPHFLISRLELTDWALASTVVVEPHLLTGDDLLQLATIVIIWYLISSLHLARDYCTSSVLFRASIVSPRA